MLNYVFLYVSMLRPGIDQGLMRTGPWSRQLLSGGQPAVRLSGCEPYGDFHKGLVNAS